MKIVIGVTTYNRKNDLISMSNSLCNVIDYDQCQVVVFDDCSTEYDKKFLEEIFPTALVFINENNFGSDANIFQMYKYFLSTDGELFINADSDLIFNKNIISKAISKIKLTDGVLSLYNSFKHDSYDSFKNGEEFFLLKKTVGSAGVVFNRKVLREIMLNVPCSRRFDWDWCAYLNRIGSRVVVTQESYIQHIGYTGYNTNHAYDMDFGLNFISGSEENDQVLQRLLELVIVDSNLALEIRLKDAYWVQRNNCLGYIITGLLKIKAIFLKCRCFDKG